MNSEKKCNEPVKLNKPVKLTKSIYELLKFAKEAGYIYTARYEHGVYIIKDLSEFLKSEDYEGKYASIQEVLDNCEVLEND